MPVLVAEDHAIVLGVERDAVEGRKRIRHRSNRRDDAADGVGRPLVGRDAAFLRQPRGRLPDGHRGFVDALRSEQCLERGLVARAGCTRAGLRRRLTRAYEKHDGGGSRNEYSTHGRSLPRSDGRDKPNGQTMARPWGAALSAPHRSGGLARFARSWAGRFSARWAPPSAAWARRYRGACPTSERKRASPSASEASAPYRAKHRPTSGRKRASPSASEASAPYGAK